MHGFDAKSFRNTTFCGGREFTHDDEFSLIPIVFLGKKLGYGS